MTPLDKYHAENRKEVEAIAKRIMRNKYYRPDWQNPEWRWKVVERERVGDHIVILAKSGMWDYAVFTDLLMPKSFPSDKFTWGEDNGRALYKEILEDEKKALRKKEKSNGYGTAARGAERAARRRAR